MTQPANTPAGGPGKSLRARLRRKRPTLRWNIQTFIVPAVLVALWGVLLLALYQWNARNEAAHVRELALLQARAFFSQIVSTRAWNAAHGGVFVLSSDLGQPNPWLPPDERTLLAADGTMLTRMNPAYMTRQISEFLTSSQGVSFRITSLHPLRPENGADAWETESLRAFGRGERETFTLVQAHDDAGLDAVAVPVHAETRHGPSFRYMAPLMADQSCLGCHRTADDTVGGLRGGISVSIAATPLLALERQRLDQMGLAYAIIGVVGLLGIGGASLQVSRKKALAEAANRMKSAFLANMSHDMRTPLTGIIGMAELLSGFQPEAATDRADSPPNQGKPGGQGKPDGQGTPAATTLGEEGAAPPLERRARYNEYLGQLRCAAANLLEIVNDITDFSCLESGRMRLAPRTFRLRPSLEACLGLFRFAGERKGLSLSLHVAENVPDALLGDDFRLRQALGNLIGNAVKFTREGGIAVVVNRVPAPTGSAALSGAAAPAGTGGRGVLLRFAVVDTGVGIPPEQQESIFESFVQGEAASALCLGGTGLGLAISREIARMLDGDIGVSSTPGQGSEFWFTACFDVAGPFVKDDVPTACDATQAAWPAGPATPSAPSTLFGHRVDARRSAPHPPLRLLVADDNPVNRLFMQDVLRSAGHEVAVAEDGVQALRLLEEIRPDMALLDVRMPGCDGTEVVRRLRAGQVSGVPADLPVLAVTASAVGRESAALLGEGMTGCVCKPLTAAMLLAAVADAAAGGTPLECPGTGGYADDMHHWRDGDAGVRPVTGAAPASPTRQPAHPPSSPLGQFGQAVPPASSAPSAPSPPSGPPPDPATSDSASTDIMDEAAALDALGGNRPLFVKLCQAFLDEVATRRAALVDAVQGGRRQDALREAHALRNSAGMLRLSALHGLCDAMEAEAGRAAPEGDAGSAATAGPSANPLADLLAHLLPVLDAGVARVRTVTTGATDTATPGTAPAKETHR
ncbi:his Kinase A domain protein [Desulfovibrio sp. A2]|nr:his Kinase A domain protein [Desulfovibrio sp. A2]